MGEGYPEAEDFRNDESDRRVDEFLDAGLLVETSAVRGIDPEKLMIIDEFERASIFADRRPKETGTVIDYEDHTTYGYDL